MIDEDALDNEDEMDFPTCVVGTLHLHIPRSVRDTDFTWASSSSVISRRRYLYVGLNMSALKRSTSGGNFTHTFIISNAKKRNLNDPGRRPARRKCTMCSLVSLWDRTPS